MRDRCCVERSALRSAYARSISRRAVATAAPAFGAHRLQLRSGARSASSSSAQDCDARPAPGARASTRAPRGCATTYGASDRSKHGRWQPAAAGACESSAPRPAEWRRHEAELEDQQHEHRHPRRIRHLHQQWRHQYGDHDENQLERIEHQSATSPRLASTTLSVTGAPPAARQAPRRSTDPCHTRARRA